MPAVHPSAANKLALRPSIKLVDTVTTTPRAGNQHDDERGDEDFDGDDGHVDPLRFRRKPQFDRIARRAATRRRSIEQNGPYAEDGPRETWSRSSRQTLKDRE
ncbi:hypothetical protein [Ideonella sp. A 288]|uniref:hypothetical protein n=1 Tax=Ideonella sp. A 288 TaxID=1962181 RepID=UPI001F44773F|nr:hypothetical protein [Ideonella sp. A 288]